MKRLADGVYAEVDSNLQQCGVLRLGKSTPRPVPVAREASLVALAHGLDDDDATHDALYDELAAEGLAGRGLAPVDARVEKRLAALGAPFAWSLGDDKDAPRLVEALRQSRAVRKLFYKSFGQTECLPESAVARCLALRADLGTTDADILLVGDDDLLSIPLSMLGFRVTSIDIDPVLIAFLARERDRLGLEFAPRVYDVLAPLDDALADRFDAVLTDPMSFYDCQIAFLSRALAVVKPAGQVLVCVHPYGRRMFERVMDALPVRMVRYRNMLSAYSYYRYSENAYRSDLCTLVRTEGPLPYAPGDRIPFEAITTGRLTWANHSGLTTTCSRLGPIRRLTADMLAGAIPKTGLGYTVVSADEVAGTLHLHLVHDDPAGRVTVRIDPAAAELSIDAVPHTPAATQLALALVQELKAKNADGFAMTGLSLPAMVLAPPG